MRVTLTVTSDEQTVTTAEEPKLMKQGDSVSLPVTLLFNGARINASNVSMLDTLEYSLGYARHTIAASDAWDDTLGKFLLPFDQADTLYLAAGYHDLDLRAKFVGGGVLGVRHKARIKVLDANSREVI